MGFEGQEHELPEWLKYKGLTTQKDVATMILEQTAQRELGVAGGDKMKALKLTANAIKQLGAEGEDVNKVLFDIINNFKEFKKVFKMPDFKKVDH